MGPRMATNMLITMLISYTRVNIAVSQLCLVFLTCAFLGIVSKVNKQTCASSMPFSFYCKFLKTTWKDRAQLHSIKGQLHYSIDIAVSTINRTVTGRASFQENIYILQNYTRWRNSSASASQIVGEISEDLLTRMYDCTSSRFWGEFKFSNKYTTELFVWKNKILR